MKVSSPIFIGEDQIAWTKRNSINLDTNVDIHDSLTIQAVVDTRRSGEDGKADVANLVDVANRAVHDGADAALVFRCRRQQLAPDSRSHRPTCRSNQHVIRPTFVDGL